MSFDLKAFQAEQKAWSRRNFGEIVGTGYRALLGAGEEMGELFHAHLKAEQGIRTNEDHHAAKVDAVADVIIYLADYCTGQGIDLEDALRTTWEQVRQRDWTKNKETGTTPTK
jgi:NTP pyrophosphatase (non-canonical NTP hydrolase)